MKILTHGRDRKCHREIMIIESALIGSPNVKSRMNCTPAIFLSSGKDEKKEEHILMTECHAVTDEEVIVKLSGCSLC